MKKTLSLILSGIVVLGVWGCGSGDAGDVKTAEDAARKAPKSVDQLPQDMPPQARAQAGAAIQQGQAMSQQAAQENAARMKAMQQGQR